MNSNYCIDIFKYKMLLWWEFLIKTYFDKCDFKLILQIFTKCEFKLIKQINRYPRICNYKFYCTIQHKQ